ncbi:MAG: DUF6508 domain-containing protein [Longimicrobiales bacterium]
MARTDALLALLPRLEDPERSFTPRIREPGESGDADPGSDPSAPWVEWPEILDELTDAIHAAGLIQDFDWMTWDEEARRYYHDPELLLTADLDIVEKLLTLHVSIDRAVAGHLAGVCTSGHMQAVLRRLREILRADA